MFTAYFDESGTHSNSPVTVVAGYIATNEQWSEFEREWKEVMQNAGIPFFHMSKFESRQGEYKNWNSDKRIRIQERLIGIIKRRVRIGFASAIRLSDYSEVMDGRDRILYGSPYAFCLISCMKLVAAWADKYEHQEPIVYVFESGAGCDGEIGAIFSRSFSKESVRSRYRVGDLAFGDKRGIVQLQAADILAYEIYKRVGHLMTDDNRKLRKSLQALGMYPHMFRDITKDEILKIVSLSEK